MSELHVGCEDGVYRIVLLEGADAELRDCDRGAVLPPRTRPGELIPGFALGSLVDVDMLGATVALLLDRRPPLLVSADAGLTWNERGGGLPPGRGLSFGPTPDDLVYAGRNRLYVSSSGAVFWRALAIELPEIHGVQWTERPTSG